MKLPKKKSKLSPRKKQIADLLDAGNSRKTIGTSLHLKPGTVNTYMGRMYEDHDAHSATELLHTLREKGLLSEKRQATGNKPKRK